MNKIFLLIIFSIVETNCFAQHLSSSEKKELKKEQDSLKSISLEIVQGRDAECRFKADSQFTKMFVRALKIKNSFYFPFDSLITISQLSPKDSSFKIFTWQLVVNDDVVRKHGAIQMRTSDGSLKLFPLIDKTNITQNINDTIANNFNWIGALYYKIIEKKSFGKDYYTLLGYDENNLNSDRKIIEVLTFKDGTPIFGGSFFSFQDNSLAKQSFARYIMEYKKSASPRLTYDSDMDMIIYEHLISETGEPDKKYTYIPDGDYEGLKWRDGKWVHIQKVFTYKTPEGQEPVPQPIRDAKGTIDETKLSKRMPSHSDENENNSDEPVIEKNPVKKKK
ncbi:MAG: hypothetical protein M3Z26_07440 [Bacteroidota bacterium]|nr:hypothetical protein [Bacteroidota bacterium]